MYAQGRSKGIMCLRTTTPRAASRGEVHPLLDRMGTVNTVTFIGCLSLTGIERNNRFAGGTGPRKGRKNDNQRNNQTTGKTPDAYDQAGSSESGGRGGIGGKA